MTLRRKRIWGIIVRHMYNFRHNYDRLVDAFYWPFLDILLWGLTISAVSKYGNIPSGYIAMILMGVTFWYIIWRGQYEISVNLLEELWAENLGNLFGSPLTLAEWLIALLSLSVFKLILLMIFAGVISYALYAANIFVVGFPLSIFWILLLVLGWSLGLIFAGLFLRYGTIVQTFAWSGATILLPLSAVYYPISTFPPLVQKISQFIPSSYVFEGIREMLVTHQVPWGMIGKSAILDAVIFALALIFVISSFRYAQKRGLSQVK